MSLDPGIDTRDRVIRLDAHVAHLAEKQDEMKVKQEDMARQISEVHDLLMQARGARWVLVAVAMGIGTLAGFSVKILAFVKGLVS